MNFHFIKENLEKLLMLLYMHEGPFTKGKSKFVPLLGCGKSQYGSTQTRAVTRIRRNPMAQGKFKLQQLVGYKEKRKT
jgi:hypothetical protein